MWKISNPFEEEKEKGWKNAQKRYQTSTEQEKEKKPRYHQKRNKSLCEEQKEKLVEYWRNYHITHNK